MTRFLILVLLCAQPAKAAHLLKALTYNVNGIPVVTPDWPAKRDAIGAKLKEGGYDLIAVQEAWSDEDAQKMISASGLPYSRRYATRWGIGTGLVVMSRYPIIATAQREFTCRPSALRWMTGEPMANKGALMVRVETPKGPLDVYTAHPVAAYPDASFTTLRWTQLFELAEMVLENSAGRPFVILGDLNTAPGDPGYKFLVDLLGLDDACLDHGKDACGITNAEDQARIDHVLAARGPGRFASAKTAFAGLIPGTQLAYSDHLAIEADIDSRVLSRKPIPNIKARADALTALIARLSRLSDAMYLREEARAWVPVYGFLLMSRYDHQREQLAAISARAESARIRVLQAAP